MIKDESIYPSSELRTIAVIAVSMISLSQLHPEFGKKAYKDFLDYIILNHGKELMEFSDDLIPDNGGKYEGYIRNALDVIKKAGKD